MLDRNASEADLLAVFAPKTDAEKIAAGLLPDLDVPVVWAVDVARAADERARAKAATFPGPRTTGFPGAPGASQDAIDAERARLDARYAAIDEAVANCRHCKSAKTRLARGTSRFGTDKCSTHARAKGLAYRTSPLSETYWSS